MAKHNDVFDIVVIGGGINGCGCAADAATRGLKVLLCEKDDLASKTSSSSSQLIHGGLRYLESFDFKLVKKALKERETLLSVAPHLIHPQPFIIPLHKNSRSPWLLRLGLFIYDNLYLQNTLPGSCFVNTTKLPNGLTPIKNSNKGLIYFDAKTNDARLTISNALQAKKYGATICTHTQVIKAMPHNKSWQLTIQKKNQNPMTITTQAVINAAGPWVGEIDKLLQVPHTQAMTFVRGSHIILPKIYEGEHAYLLQNSDKRVVFTIPYFNYTLVGTTEVNQVDIKQAIIPSDIEINYLLEMIRSYFEVSFDVKNIIHKWSGIRPLIANAKKTARKLSRNYRLQYQENPAPILSIYGGKITTYRQLAEEALESFKPVFDNLAKSKTKSLPLPGGKLNDMNFYDFISYFKNTYHWLPLELSEHYLTTYGTNATILLQGCNKIYDLGLFFGAILTQKEVDYLISDEWATCAEDILWRRTKLGLSIDASSIKQLEEYISNYYN